MKKINVIITGQSLAEHLGNYFEKHKMRCLFLPNCTGYSAKFNMIEYCGFMESKKYLLAFKASETETKAIERFVLKFFDYKNNGIMFSLKGDENMEKDLLYVAIVNSGFGEKCATIIRKNAHVGSTVIDARGKGTNAEELFGVEIESGKDVVLSVMPAELITGIKRKIKYGFSKDKTDIVSFILPVSEFSKLHSS